MQSKYNKMISPGIHIIYTLTSKLRARKSFINVYAKFLRDGTRKCMCVQNKEDETRTVLCVIAQRHLKTFIEEYLGSTQIFNHSVPSSLVVNLYSQGFIVENTEKAISFHSLFRAAFSFISCAHTNGHVDPVLSEICNSRLGTWWLHA